MVENWDQARRNLPGAHAVMITDASNKERDEINALTQERRAQAGELGSHRVNLPDKPYGLVAGDEVMFTGQYRVRERNGSRAGSPARSSTPAARRIASRSRRESANHARWT